MNTPNSDHGPAPELEPPLEAAVWSVLRQPLDAEAIARVAARAEALLPDGLPEPQPQPEVQPARSAHTIFSRSLIVKSLSTVAAVAFVCGVTVFMQPTSSAFADVVKQLKSAPVLSYVTRVYIEGSDKPIESKVQIAKDGRHRQELAGGVVSVVDASHQVRMTLLTAQKVALLRDSSDEPIAGDSQQLKWLELLKSRGDKPDGDLGQRTVDGKTIQGYLVKQGEQTIKVWINPKTKDLVEVEHDMPVKGSSITRVVMTDFQFRETVDESLFSFDVPKGYKVQKQAPVPKSLGGEESLIEALRGYTKRSEGKFPASVTDWGDWAVLLSKDSTDGTLPAEATAVMHHLGAVMPFLTTLSKKDYEYTGAGKSLTDKRCIVFWHKTKEGKLRAVFNDLTASEVTEKELP